MADRVMPRHLRMVRSRGKRTTYCVPGTRAFFEKHGLDFRDFMRNGIPIEEVEQFDDVMVRRVIEVARNDVEQD